VASSTLYAHVVVAAAKAGKDGETLDPV